MISANLSTVHPDVIEYDPIPLKPKPKPIPPAPLTSPTSPMAPIPVPDTVAEPVPSGRSAWEYTTTLLLSPGQSVKPNDIRKGTQASLLEKVNADGSLVLSPINNPKITVTSGTSPNTYEIQIATKDESLHGKVIYVTIILAAQGIAGVATDQFT
jgi:hypothetical protein